MFTTGIFNDVNGGFSVASCKIHAAIKTMEKADNPKRKQPPRMEVMRTKKNKKWARRQTQTLPKVFIDPYICEPRRRERLIAGMGTDESD